MLVVTSTFGIEPVLLPLLVHVIDVLREDGRRGGEKSGGVSPNY